MPGGLHLGLQKTTLLDYPGEVACTVFFAGCNFRCPYCHNPELVKGKHPPDFLTEKQIIDFIKKRKNVLGGVCITGGEPLLSTALPEIIKKIKDFGLKVKVDTNGSLPDRLMKTEADYFAMDIKTSMKKYQLLGGTAGKTDKIMESIKYLMSGSIDYEFRTTAVPDLITIEDMWEIARMIEGAKHYAIAQYRSEKTLDPLYSNITPYPDSKIKQLAAIPAHLGIPVSVRGI